MKLARLLMGQCPFPPKDGVRSKGTWHHKVYLEAHSVDIFTRVSFTVLFKLTAAITTSHCHNEMFVLTVGSFAGAVCGHQPRFKRPTGLYDMEAAQYLFKDTKRL
jgi:hypothetical protein